MLKLYYHPSSRASRVRWALEELNVPYELLTLDHKNGFNPTEYQKIHPLLMIPALVDQGFSVFETSAIIMYLADKYQDLAPKAHDIQGRGKYYQWMFFAVNELDPKTSEIYLQTSGYDEDKRNELVEKTTREAFQRRALVLSEHLANQQYMLGSEFSMVDVVIASILGWAEELELLEAFPNLLSYCQRMKNRPAAKRAQAESPVSN